MAAPHNDQELAQAGPLFMVGLPGPRLDRETRELLQALRVGGVILFARNLEAPEQVWKLTRDLQQAALAAGDLPLLIAVDQEGGPVQRLKEPFTRIPAARELGTAATPAEVERLSEQVGRELALVGINMNLAPVLDVARSNACPQWERSYSPDPQQVAAFGVAALRGLLKGGVLPAAKHFPGLGDTTVDSHQVLPTAQNPDPERTADLLPFRQAVAAGVPVIMTAHLHVPAWDSQTATLSPVVLKDWLRTRLGFQGVIITDDLEMGAIAGEAPAPEAACQALAAGADLLLICNQGEAAWKATELIRRDRALQPAIGDSWRRLQRLRQRLPKIQPTRDDLKAYFGGGGFGKL
ncbi:MAG: beta-N-acetylhexosaminidase [Desulfobaccales bacterium]